MAYFTDDSLLPENMAPLIITAAPYAAPWLCSATFKRDKQLSLG